ncbi:MAG: hypothetical protein A3J83_02690 [Elusimicrobia bacterium RIFOXYA2_FULL_40_6]|nr:MAG: hypothetical protein A3J83_02690 [Elusimicrobia bacterium RIFOXYA2_FULL_40_6]
MVSFFANDVPVTVGKVGQVVDTTQDVKTKGYLNGKSALLIEVYKRSGSNTVDVSDNILKKVSLINKSLEKHEGAPKIQIVRDNAKAIRMNLEDVKLTIFEGIFLAIIVVYLFLGNFKSTFITIMALPNSLIGAFILMGIAGFSVNMLTLMALSLAVGLLIDDAIVVRENIFRHIEEGEDPKSAAEKGTNEVMLAVVATTLAIIAVFLPVGFLQGMVGQFFKEFGLTIVFAMTISLFDALTVAPMLSAYLIGKIDKTKKPSWLEKVVYAPADKFNDFYNVVEKKYEQLIKFTLKHKLRIILISLAVLVLSLGSVVKIPKTFMPTNEWGEFFVNLEAKPGTSLNQMDKYAVQIDELLRKEKEIEMVSISVGNTNGESNVASLYVQMVPSNKRKRSTGDMKVYVRKLLDPYKEAMNPKVADVSMAGEDSPFFVILKGNDLETLSNEASILMEKFKTIPGLVDIDTNYKAGKPEYQVKMIPSKMVKLGVQSISAGMELRGMVEGLLPAKYRENGMEYDIRVMLNDNQKDISRQFDQLYVPNVNMQLVKLKNVAEPIVTTGPSKIFRRNRSRYVAIMGNLGKNGAIADITAQAKKILDKEKLPEGVEYEFSGSSEDFVDLFRNMIIAAGLSVVFIYFVLASLYESLIIPFTIMMALPLAIIGALLALLITGHSINMFTMIALIMLFGLATKNSILLVDYTQQLMRKGLPRDEALVRAGVVRLRPILMTTFALIAGMLPLALGLSEVGKFRSSMGVAIIGGLISSTFLTLVIIPAVFGYMDTFRLWTRKLLGRPLTREIDREEE